ncbi:MAG TPA: polyprenyl synthetase family protein [Ktedonobacteraceae bacterium]|nr:polyprenyl synthetase family protein [Ktedonobacteraceae bacterium]
MTSATDDTQGSEGPFEVYQRILRERLRFFLDPLQSTLRSDIMRALQETGKLLDIAQTDKNAPVPAGSWSLLTLLTALSIAPNINLVRVSSVAVSVECLICALDLLDDVEDGDQTAIIKESGPARVLNVSTALLVLAQRMVLSVSEREFPAADILRCFDTIQESLLVAITGQQRDLLAEQRAVEQVTVEECIEIASEKAGALMSLACRMGALCTGANDEVCEQYALLGQLLGISHQLDNDCHDLYYLLQGESVAQSMDEGVSIAKQSKTDLIRSKKTLPIVLAAQSQRAFHSEGSDIANGSDDQKALREGIMAAWGICLLYRERARDQLQRIEAQQPISHTLRLLLGFV